MIGAARYFAPTFWAARFFPKVGDDTAPVVPDPPIVRHGDHITPGTVRRSL